MAQVSRDLKIKQNFLEALEEGRFEDFSSPVHLTGFLKNYAFYLGLNVEEVLAFFRRDFGGDLNFRKIKGITTSSAWFGPEKLTKTAIATLFSLFFLYLFYQYRSFTRPPILEVLNPPADLVVKDLRIEVSGRTCRECLLRVNEEELNPSPEGNFAASVVLRSGANVLVFVAVNRSGRETRVVRNAIVEP